MVSSPKISAPLIIIGGAEDRFKERVILKRFIEMAGGSQGCILIISIASEEPEITAGNYERIFRKLGARETRVLTSSFRGEILECNYEALLNGITGIFFSGGDQLKISSLLGGTPFLHALDKKIHTGEVVVGGTSAGASVMSETMIIDWDPADQPLCDNVRMSSGLGILNNIIIDQHFTERSRINRLITAVAYHPGNLGFGIDEDTAIIISKEGLVEVIGAGTATIIDGSGVTECSIAKAHRGGPFTITGLKIHVLSDSVGFHLYERRPLDLSDAHESFLKTSP